MLTLIKKLGNVAPPLAHVVFVLHFETDSVKDWMFIKQLN